MIRKNIVDDVFYFVVQLPEERLADLNIKMLTEHFDISRCHLSHKFYDERGMKLTTFIKCQKLLRAEHLLAADCGMTIKELALLLGYPNCQYFISRFKKQWGESPGRYHKMFTKFSK